MSRGIYAKLVKTQFLQTGLKFGRRLTRSRQPLKLNKQVVCIPATSRVGSKNDAKIVTTMQHVLVYNQVFLNLGVMTTALNSKSLSLYKGGSTNSFFWAPFSINTLPGDYCYNCNILGGSLFPILYTALTKVGLDYPLSFVGNRYAKAKGVYITSLEADIQTKKLYKIYLPSGNEKYISVYTYYFENAQHLIEGSPLQFKQKARSYFNKTKPITRGVAMNPVDHPHGGRTKTNQPEISKWGWVAKHNR